VLDGFEVDVFVVGRAEDGSEDEHDESGKWVQEAHDLPEAVVASVEGLALLEWEIASQVSHAESPDGPREEVLHGECPPDFEGISPHWVLVCSSHGSLADHDGKVTSSIDEDPLVPLLEVEA